MSKVRTRFAPSPTGYMHIGGMRTALFNWLWARHNQGTFILRIDDTDQERNVEEALAPILHAFRWLGLNWDEGPEVGGPHGPYYQSQRGELYQQAVEKLLAEGKAFRDFDPPELVREDREAAEKEKRNYVNLRRSLELSPQQVQEKLEAGQPHVVRLLVPREDTIQLDDIVRGHVEWSCAEMSDPVLVRSNGGPLYNFATVVDDALMEITHVIRAEEHLSNTPVQLLIYRALGHQPPQFAHIPFITAPGSSKKLSKRDLQKLRNNPQMRNLFEAGDRIFGELGLGNADTISPVLVEYYEQIGYLPAGVLNALARLGWSYDDKTETMDRDFLIQNFTLDRVVKSSAGFDAAKLMSFQEHWMNQLSPEEKAGGCLHYLIQAGILPSEPGETVRQLLRDVIITLGDRLKIFGDILDSDFFFRPDDELRYDEKNFEKRLKNSPTAVELLKKFREKLATIEPFDVPMLEQAMHDFLEAEEAKMGDVIHALRLSTTGVAKGPGMFETLALLGRDHCLNRIDLALQRV